MKFFTLILIVLISACNNRIDSKLNNEKLNEAQRIKFLGYDLDRYDTIRIVKNGVINLTVLREVEYGNIPLTVAFINVNDTSFFVPYGDFKIYEMSGSKIDKNDLNLEDDLKSLWHLFIQHPKIFKYSVLYELFSPALGFNIIEPKDTSEVHNRLKRINDSKFDNFKDKKLLNKWRYSANKDLPIVIDRLKSISNQNIDKSFWFEKDGAYYEIIILDNSLKMNSYNVDCIFNIRI